MAHALRIVQFVGIALVIHVALSVAYLRTAAHEHRASQLDRAFLADESPLDLLVVGDSHARNAFDPDLIPATTSVALGGEHYLKTLYRLEWLLDRSPREVRAVALNLDLTSFTSWKADQFAPEAVWGRYVPLLRLGVDKGMPWAYAGKALKAHAVPYAGEVETLVQYVQGKRAFREEPGLGRFDGLGPAARRRIARETVRKHFYGQDPVDPSMDRALVQLIDRLRSRDIEVVLVSYPLTEEYVAVAERVGIRAEVRAHAEARARSRSDLTWLDFEDLYFGRSHLFFDADHLNTLGRAHFTRWLYDDLVERGVIGGR